MCDDAAVFPPGNAELPDAVAAHRRHRASRYAPLVGPLLVPASRLAEAAAQLGPDEVLKIGVIADGGAAPAGLPALLGALEALHRGAGPVLDVRQVEVPVAMRGQDPLPGLRAVLAADLKADLYAEIPLTFGLVGALDALADARAAGVRAAAKFRTGGLAAELFPTTDDLAAVIVACTERNLPFKCTAGLHHALLHTDRETGFTHHGFLNILVGALAAADGAGPRAVASLLAATDPVRLVEPARLALRRDRPLWVGFGTCSIAEPLADLTALNLLDGNLA